MDSQFITNSSIYIFVNVILNVILLKQTRYKVFHKSSRRVLFPQSTLTAGTLVNFQQGFSLYATSIAL